MSVEIAFGSEISSSFETRDSNIFKTDLPLSTAGCPQIDFGSASATMTQIVIDEYLISSVFPVNDEGRNLNG